jgi:hypothetical protein
MRAHRGDLGVGQGARDVLLVSEDEQAGAGEAFLEQKSVQLGLAVGQAQPVARIDDPDDGIGLRGRFRLARYREAPLLRTCSK